MNEGNAMAESDDPPAAPGAYCLETLVESRSKDKNWKPAPPDIARQLMVLLHNDLEDDKKQHLWADGDSLFAAVPVNLNDDGIPDCLVFPAVMLPSFHGAHSIAFWFFRRNLDGTHVLVMDGRTDCVRILPHKTNEFRDIETIYGMLPEISLHTYDGRRYQFTKPQTPPGPGTPTGTVSQRPSDR